MDGAQEKKRLRPTPKSRTGTQHRVSVVADQHGSEAQGPAWYVCAGCICERGLNFHAEFDARLDGDQIRCRICYGAIEGAGFRDSQSKDEHWIARSSATSHRNSQLHKQNVALQAAAASTSLLPGSAPGTAPMSLPSSAYSHTPAPVQYMLHPLQPPVPATSYSDSTADYAAMDVDLESNDRNHMSSDELDDLSLSPEEEAEQEHRQQQEDELHFVRALAEMALGGPLDADDGEVPVATDPLDEMAELDGT